MALKTAYQRIARRSLDAADAAIGVSIQEKAAFLAYHAFESTGCALSLHVGNPVGAHVGHKSKIHHFLGAAKKVGGHAAIASVAILIGGLRNGCLYPQEDVGSGTVTTPEKAISIAQAKDLRKRVKGVVDWVEKKL